MKKVLRLRARGFAAGCVERLCSLRSGDMGLPFGSRVSIEQTSPHRGGKGTGFVGKRSDPKIQ